jgi:hypothetical protein
MRAGIKFQLGLLRPRGTLETTQSCTAVWRDARTTGKVNAEKVIAVRVEVKKFQVKFAIEQPS